MGARQSRRSVDITTTPKKDGVPTEGGVVGDAAAPGDGKLERIEETDSKPISNGVASHTEVAADKEDKDKDKDESSEKDKEKVQPEDTKTEEAKPDGTPSQDTSGTEGAEVTTPSAEATPANPNAATSPESKETKKKDKLKKKWSFRSISFSKKDKNKPSREDTPKNGDVTKEEPLAESGEEVEGAAAAASSPTEEKSAAISSVAPEADDSAPAVAETAAPAEPAEEAAAKLAVSESANATVESKKEEEKPAATATPTPTPTASSVPSGESFSPVEKKEESSPSAPTPVPVEEKKEEIEKVEIVAADKVEVSPVQTIAPVEVSRAQPIATPSIIERKTSEDIPSLLPSSPPPTPIDPSPLQQAQQAAANASAIAEALKLPAEAAHEDTTLVTSDTIIDTTITTTTIIATSPLDLSTLNTRSGTTTTTTADTTITDSITDSLLATSSSAHAGDRAPVPSENSSEFYRAKEIISLEELPNVSENGTEGISPKTSKSIVFSLTDKQSESEPLVAKSLTDEEKELAMIERQDGKDMLTEVIKEEVQLIFNEESLSSSALGEILSKESIDSRGDLVIQSEEGPLPISGELIAEAKPALVIPEHNLVSEVAQKNMEDEPSFTEKKEEPLEVILDVCKKQVAEVESEVACPLPPNVEYLKETISAPIISTKDILEDDVPPPLPDSPVPILEPTSKSFIPDELPDELIESSNPQNQEVEDEITLCQLPSKNVLEVTEYPLSGDISEDVTSARHEPPLVCPIPCKDVTSPATTIESFPVYPACPPSVEGDLELLQDQPIPDEVLDKLPEYPAHVKTELSSVPVLSNAAEIPVESDAPEMPIVEKMKEEEVARENTLPTPPRSPKSIPNPDTVATPSQNFPFANASKTESSQAAPIAELNTEDIKVESCDVSDIELKERLAQSKGTNGEESTPAVCSNSKASSIAVPENEQVTPEPEVAEKEATKPSANETSTTESVDEAPTSPPPAVPVEVSQAPAAPVSTPASAPAPAPVVAPAPAITEDVASVTKAIEEIDINEKAVAAAVNEAIESNTNELVNDSCHQNNMNE